MNAKEARYKRNVEINKWIFFALIAASYFISLWWLIPTVLFGVFAIPYWLLANEEPPVEYYTPEERKMKRMMQDALWQESERQRQNRNR